MLFFRAQERGCKTIVLYFQHAAIPVDHQGGVAIILRFVCRQLVTRGEDQCGLRLYFGDHDNVGASKMHNFDNSDKVIVCLTREFIDDIELPGDGARQQQAAAQVHLCLVRRFPTYFHSPTSIATAPTRHHLHPAHVGQPGRRE